MSLAITALVENNPAAHKCLANEHGLALLLETEGKRILLDTGASGSFLANARRINIDLSDLDCVVLSHGHYDHTGGFRELIETFGVKKLYHGKDFFLPKYEIGDGKHSYIGLDFDASTLDQWQIDAEECRTELRIGENIWLIGDFERTTPWEAIPPELGVLKDGALRPDPFAEEICIAVKTGSGLAVVVGCAHPGIVNILKTVERRLGLPIHSVWGGAHLKHADEAVIAKTVLEFSRMGIGRLGLCHCSGQGLLDAIEAEPDLKLCRLRTGDGVFL